MLFTHLLSGIGMVYMVSPTQISDYEAPTRKQAPPSAGTAICPLLTALAGDYLSNRLRGRDAGGVAPADGCEGTRAGAAAGRDGAAPGSGFSLK